MGIRFTCGIADQTPLNITRMVSGGVGFLDYDGDGFPDLVLAGIRGVRLYHNEGGHGFREVTAGSGLDHVRGEPQGVASADYDADGLPDLLITGYDGVTLLRNTGGGHFKDVTLSAGLTVRGWTTSAAFADVDGDGWLDLYVGRYVRFRPGMPEYQKDGPAQLALGPDAYPAEQGVFYRSRGNGTFREATREVGLADAHGKNLGVIFTDFDGDGDVDLYLANDQALGDCYVNDGRGHFRNAAVENGTAVSGIAAKQAGMGVDWGDYDHDGRLDLIVTTFYSEAKSLYHQEAGGVFREAAQSVGLTQPLLRGTAFGVRFFDADNDGWQDLVLANGHVQDQLDRIDPDTGYRQRTQVFRNERGFFHEASAGAGPAFQQRIVGRGLAVADWDGDGKEDVAVANFAGPPLLLHNESDAGHWVTIRLAGRGGNRNGIGATVTVTTPGGRQVQPIITGRSYLAASLPEAHFGLGTAISASAEVRWPDGTKQQVASLPLNQLVVLQHP